MKRFGNLYGRICDFENLVLAARRARRKKRYRHDVAAFHYDMEKNILQLQEELREKNYKPSPYRAFHIRDPKPRMISAAPYRDRVVHHAVCQVIEPIFERTFIYESYASRMGKGTHKALDRCTHFSRRYAYALKGDVEKYFPSMDHRILISSLSRKIKCRDTLWLLKEIIDHSNPQEAPLRYFPDDDLLAPMERRRGIPIGNLTSQFFGNVYLNPFDHFIKETIQAGAYIRFNDDFLVFSDDKAWLNGLRERLQAFLNDFRLRLHSEKCQVIRTRCGIPFLGWQVYPDHRRIKRKTGVRFARRLKELRHGQDLGHVSLAEIHASIQSWIGHLNHGDTWGLRRKLLGAASFSPDSTKRETVLSC